MLLSVITVAYKNWKVVEELLSSIDKYNDIGDDLEVIIVDNSPENEKIGEKFVFSNYSFPIIYRENQNNGFGGGNNAGFAASSGEYIAFLNPDVILIEPIFKKIISKFQNNKNIAEIGIRVLDKKGRPGTTLFFDFETTWLELFLQKYVNRYGIYFQKWMSTSGADIFIKRDVFEKVGKFDENIFMYYEELDLSRRITKKFPNMIKVYMNNIKIVHEHGACTEVSPDSMQKMLYSCEYVAKKHGLDFAAHIKAIYSYELFKNMIKKVIGLPVLNEEYLTLLKSRLF